MSARSMMVHGELARCLLAQNARMPIPNRVLRMDKTSTESPKTSLDLCGAVTSNGLEHGAT
jgi:hypothetical protein